MTKKENVITYGILSYDIEIDDIEREYIAKISVSGARGDLYVKITGCKQYVEETYGNQDVYVRFRPKKTKNLELSLRFNMNKYIKSIEIRKVK